MQLAAHSPLRIASRVLAGVVGTWGFVWGFAVFGIAALVAAGMDYNEAYRLIMMLAFLVFLVLFCWAFVASSLLRVWGVLAGGGLLMTVAGWQLTRHLAG